MKSKKSPDICPAPMNERPYPTGLDRVWMASDRDGRVAAFVTAGYGPMPSRILWQDLIADEEIDSEICKMPKISAVCLTDPEWQLDYIDLAEYGFFVYDWDSCLHMYKKIAFPARPTIELKLSKNLASIAKAVKFTNISFRKDMFLRTEKFRFELITGY